MAYCYDHAIPHSEFMEWEPEDRAKVMAVTIERSQRCDTCGTAPWEWDEKQGGSKFAYEPEEKFCQGCYIRQRATEDRDTLPGVTIELVKLSKVEKARRKMTSLKRKKRDRANRLKEGA